MQGSRTPGACLLGAVALLLLTTSASAAARIDESGRLVLAPGDQAVIHIDDHGRLAIDSTSNSDPSKVVDIAPPANRISVTLRLDATVGTLMTVRNGFDHPLNYSAIMTVGPAVTHTGKSVSQPTSVCTLLPHVPVFENWHYAVDVIQLFDFVEAPTDSNVCR
jgi:hypothetical protein